MKIIKNNQVNSEYPKRIECDYCKSVLEIDKSDLKVGAFGVYEFVCPICKKTNSIDDGVEITIDNLKFPDHFYSSKNGLDRSPDEIKDEIRRGIQYFRKYPEEYFWFTESGNTQICIRNCSEDGDSYYAITVTKDYYSIDLDYQQEDYDARNLFGVKE